MNWVISFPKYVTNTYMFHMGTIVCFKRIITNLSFKEEGKRH